MDIVEVSEGVARTAGDAAERHALRSHDAIQLASALVLGEPGTVVVTLDARLRRAALASGLAVAP